MGNNTIKILITGDFAPRLRVTEAILHGDYESIFGEIKPLIQKVDYSITNLEAPLIDNGIPIAKTGPNLKAPCKSIEALKYAGFNMVTLANNHIMDYGKDGLSSTIDLCRKNNIEYVGAGMNARQAQEIRYISLKGKSIACINIAENEWSTTTSERPGANALSEISVFYQINEAKQKADYTIIIIHGGHELYGLPSPRMKRLYRWFIDIGADAVISHHTHCFSGDEIYKTKPIVYSLGNFVFDHKTSRNTLWNKCAIAILEIQNDSIELKLIPMQQCGETIGAHLVDECKIAQFNSQRQWKNAIINNDKLLEQYYEEFVKSKTCLYSSYMEPIKNKYILGLMNRGILPRFVRGGYKRLLLNIIRTETHRDIILKILSK